MATDSSDQVRVWVGRGIGIALLIAIIIGGWRVAHIRAEARNQAALDRHMRDMGLAFKAYAAAELREPFPPPSRTPGILFFDAASVYPHLLIDHEAVVSPRRADARQLLARLREAPLREDESIDPALVEEIGAESFYYLGFVVENELVGRAFVEAYRAAAAEADGAMRLDGDLTVHFPEDYDGPRAPSSLLPGAVWRDDGPGNSGTNTIRRIREGVERFLGRNHITGPDSFSPAQSQLPVLLERPIAEGAAIRVLYMDGHIARVPFGQFPNTRAFLDELESLRDLRPAAAQ